jgi:hypothetical protein
MLWSENIHIFPITHKTKILEKDIFSGVLASFHVIIRRPMMEPIPSYRVGHCLHLIFYADFIWLSKKPINKFQFFVSLAEKDTGLIHYTPLNWIHITLKQSRWDSMK